MYRHCYHQAINLQEFFDNSTVAGIIVLILGGLIGGHLYNKQKKIDRDYNAADRLANAVNLILERCRSVNQVIDRLANSWITIKSDKMTSQQKQDFYKDFIDNSIKYELEIMGDLMMNQLPEDISKVQGIQSMYFDDNEDVKAKIKDFGGEVKRWHDYVSSFIFGRAEEKFDLNTRVADMPKLSLTVMHDKMKEIIKIINVK